MSRPKSTQPAYQFHVSGQARVTLAGKDFYLGKHGTPESYSRYHALLAEYNANGLTVPEEVPTHQADESITIRCVTADFRLKELDRFAGSHKYRFGNLLKLLNAKYGNLAVDEFGPRKLESIREGLVKKGNCRRYVNEQVRNIIDIIRHGVGRELVRPETVVALEALKPLRKGQAKDNPEQTPASIDDVRATMPHLSPTLSAMVRIQLATAMRPSELFRMTPDMIDRSGEVWIHRPDHHKTEHHGKTKAVPILGDALEALTPFMFGGGDAICFMTTKGTPWNKDTYRRQVTRAAEKAGVLCCLRQSSFGFAWSRIREATITNSIDIFADQFRVYVRKLIWIGSLQFSQELAYCFNQNSESGKTSNRRTDCR